MSKAKKEPRRVVPMWYVYDKDYNEGQLYHHSDEQRARSKGTPKYVWVGVPEDYFIGTVQRADLFEGFIFDNEDVAYQVVDENNKELVR